MVGFIRLARFDRKHWRESYKALILLEHLLTHGPASVAEEFQTDRDVIKELQSFQHVDERGCVTVCDPSPIHLFAGFVMTRSINCDHCY